MKRTARVTAICLLLAGFGSWHTDGGSSAGTGATQSIVSIAGCSSASFTGATAAQTVCTPTVNLSPASPSFSGSLSLTGTQTGSGNDASSFAIVGGAVETAGCTGTVTCSPGQYNINIVATGPYTNSGYSQPVTVQANGTGTGGAGWQLAFSDEFNGTQLENLTSQPIASMTWSSTNGGQAAVVLPSPLPNIPSTPNSMDVSLSGVRTTGTGGSSLVNGTFIINTVTDSQHFTVYMPGTSAQYGTLGVGSASIGTGPWYTLLSNNTTPGSFSNFNGDQEGYNPHNCSESGGNLVITGDNVGWTDPNGVHYVYGSCHVQAYNGTTGWGQNQELYIDYNAQVAGGGGHGQGLHQTLWAMSPVPWDNGPEEDVAEWYGRTDSATTTVQYTTWPGSGGSGDSSGQTYGFDTGLSFNTYGLDLSLSSAQFNLNGSQQANYSTGIPPSVSWFPILDMAIGDDQGVPDGNTTFPATMLVDYARVYKKVSTGACYTTIPGASTIPHTGSCSSAPAYAGICDTITGGCAEGWSMTRAVTSAYNGPLFQIALYSSPSTTMDIPQTTAHLADMTGALSFCGGSYANCAISKMYAQIQGHSNDVVPNFLNIGGFANAPANCGDRDTNTALSCACPLQVDATSGVPENPLNVNSLQQCQYTIANDASAAGVTGGSASDIGIMLVGRAPNAITQSCSAFGSMHSVEAEDVGGTDFGTGISYGFGDYQSCSANNQYCLFADLESNSQPVSNGFTSSQPYTVGMMSWAHGSNTLSGIVNGHTAWTPQVPQWTMNAGNHIHIGGGGDLCASDFFFFEGILTNSVISSGDYANALANVEAAYPSLTFP